MCWCDTKPEPENRQIMKLKGAPSHVREPAPVVKSELVVGVMSDLNELWSRCCEVISIKRQEKQTQLKQKRQQKFWCSECVICLNPLLPVVSLHQTKGTSTLGPWMPNITAPPHHSIVFGSCLVMSKVWTCGVWYSEVPPHQHSVHPHTVTAAEHSCSGALCVHWPFKSVHKSEMHNAARVCRSAERLTVHLQQRCSCPGRGCLTPGVYRSPFAHCDCRER